MSFFKRSVFHSFLELKPKHIRERTVAQIQIGKDNLYYLKGLDDVRMTLRELESLTTALKQEIELRHTEE